MRILIVLFLLVGGLLAQRTWVVRCTAGPGVDFTDLPPAVAAAAPRDTILVVADPSCTSYSATLIDKPLRVVGVQGTPVIAGLLEVRAIQAGERLLLAGFAISPLPRPGTTIPSGLFVHDCAGSVHLQNLQGIVQASVCDHLVLHGCQLRATSGPPQPLTGSCSILLRRTTAALHRCGLDPAVNSDTLVLEDSSVTLVDSYVNGPSAYMVFDPWLGLIWYSAGGFAVHQNGSSLTLGPGASVCGGLLPLAYGLEPAILATGNSSLVGDPTSRITSHCLGVQPSIRIVPAVLIDSVFRNRSFTVSVRGEPNDFALLGLGDYAPPGVALPGVRGQLLLAPQGLFLPAAAVLPATGTFQFTFTMDPGFPMDVVLAMQAGLIHGNGTLELTKATPFSVLWEPGRNWP